MSFPSEVASKQYNDVSGNIGPVAIFTPAHPGFFRVSYYMQGKQYRNPVHLSLAWHDDYRSQFKSDTWTNTLTEGDGIIWIGSGSLTLTTVQGGGSIYDLFITVEQLQ